MPSTVFHPYVNPQIDDGDPGVTGPDEWNAGHTVVIDSADVDHGGTQGLGDDDHTQYHNNARALTWLGTRSTSDLPQGSNLYFTNAAAIAAVGGSASALTRTNDTNVTLTLGGTPSIALLNPASLTLGWTGLLGLARGGTHADLSATGGTGQYLKQATAGADITVGTIPASDIGSGAALTRTNDTNVTATLGGSPATALLNAASITLGWTGTLAIARGGTGQATAQTAFDALSPMTTIGDIIYGAASGSGTRLAGNTTGTRKFLRGTGAAGAATAPVWDTVVAADIPASALTKVDDTNVTLALGGSPAVALLAAASLTLGWTGTLAIARGGTGQATKQAAFDALSPTAALGDIIAHNGTNNVALSLPSPISWLTGKAGVGPAWAPAGALTKADDTNVTLTLGGAPSFALLNAVSLTLGWTGFLGLSRGGTHTDLSGSGGAGQVLKQVTTGADITVGTLAASDIASGAALTKVDDTNVTLALGGTPASALLKAVSLTLSWTGTLAVARGGIGIGTLASNGVLYGNGTSAVQALAVNSTATNKFLSQVSSGAPAWNVIAAADLPGAFSGFANPSASVGLAAINGSATTAMRSDGAPALNVGIIPTWTGTHTWANTNVVVGAVITSGAVFATAFSPASALGTAQAISIAPVFNAQSATVTTAYGLNIFPTYQGTAPVYTSAISLVLSPPTFTAKPVTSIGMQIGQFGSASITTAVGLDIGAQTGATNNFSIRNAGNSVQTGYARFGGVTAPLNVTAGDTTAIRGHFGTDQAFASSYTLENIGGFFHTGFNAGSRPTSDNVNGGLVVGWNYGSGLAEVDFWNVYDAGLGGFVFKQKTGAATHSDIFSISSSGVANALLGFQINGGATLATYLRGNGTNYVSSALLVADQAGWNRITTGTNYAIQAADVVGYAGLALNVTAGVTITLPNPATAHQCLITVTYTGTGTITITHFASESITTPAGGFVTSDTLVGQFKTIGFISDGGNWIELWKS